MIYHISGKLSHATDTTVIVDVSGVGYQIFVPGSVMGSLPTIGDSLKLYTYHYIREDQQTLYGFLTEQDRSFFTVLTSVSGVGPKVGIAILSALSVAEFVDAILNGNLAVLTSVSGVGKKMAERLIIELKDKLPKIYGDSPIPATADASVLGNMVSGRDDELVMALKALGYADTEIRRAIKSASPQLGADVSLEDSVRVLLKYIA